MKTNSQEQVTGQSPLPNICSMQHPSVTTVLSPFTDFSDIRPDILAAAAERGSRVHAACAAHVNGLWADCFLLQEEKGYFKSFLDWSSRAVSEFRAVEMELADPKLSYMGHPDAIVKMSGDIGLTVIDYKTPITASKTWLPQIAAYAHLARTNGYDVKRGLAVRLKKTGGSPISTEIDIDGEPWMAFLNALGAYRYFKKSR
jgi:hypothetical protein